MQKNHVLLLKKLKNTSSAQLCHRIFWSVIAFTTAPYHQSKCRKKLRQKIIAMYLSKIFHFQPVIVNTGFENPRGNEESLKIV